MSRWSWLAVVCLLVASPALAQRAAVRLRYSRGAGAEHCPDESAVRAAVAARLGYRPWRDDAERLLIVVYSAQGGRLGARIELRDASGSVVGQRELSARGDDCAELARAGELAIAIAIDPLASTAPAGPDQPGSLPVFPPPAPMMPPPPPEEPEAPAADRASVPIRLAASLGGLLAVGSAPAPAGGFQIQLRLRWRRFSGAIEGRFDLPARQDVAGGEVSSSLALGGVVPCVHLGPAAGCAVVLLGALRGAGHDLARAENATLFYAAAGARVGVELPLVSVVSARLHGDLLGTLTRISLRETGSGDAFWTTPVVSGAFGLAVVVRLL